MKTAIQHSIARLAVASSLLLLCACAAQQASEEGFDEPIYSYQRIVPEGVGDPAGEAYDPWSGMNKRIYNFNYKFDRYVFLPAVRGYQWIMPDFAEKGVSNFFNNIRDVNTLVNSILQLKPDKAAQATGRVMVNTTLGLFGLFDMATNMDIPRPQEDFGQTLGRWGVGTGPYLVVPFLGPSNLRDGIGLLPDFLLQNAIYEETIASPQRNYMGLLNALDTRAQVPFRYFETGSAYEYETVRWLISTKRELDVAK
jgi:phospholipid-binding lipoprotein MlaA